MKAQKSRHPGISDRNHFLIVGDYLGKFGKTHSLYAIDLREVFISCSGSRKPHNIKIRTQDVIMLITGW
jgi:hypothetical protein